MKLPTKRKKTSGRKSRDIFIATSIALFLMLIYIMATNTGDITHPRQKQAPFVNQSANK